MTKPNSRDWIQILFFLLFIRPLIGLFLGIGVRGRGHLPKSGPVVLVANHTSHLDAAMLLCLFPLSALPKVRPAAAADYFGRNPIVMALARYCFNILPIARTEIDPENHPVDQMAEVLRGGTTLILFPEGRRTPADQDLGPFRSGISRVLERVPEVPVVPCYLVNTGRSLPKGEMIPIPVFCEIRIGAPFHFEGTKEEFMSRIRGRIEQLGTDSVS